MHIPVLFGIIITFVIWLQYESRKAKRRSKQSSEQFWHLEQEANLTRRVDITNLNYITIPIANLPIADHKNITLNLLRDSIIELSNMEILNLTGLSNTKLKLKYGVSNIKHLSECDNNYTILVRTLQKWSELLYSEGYVFEAVTVLEFATSCATDVRKTYKLLANIYIELKTPDKIDNLINDLSNIKLLCKDNLIDELRKTQNSN